MTFATGAISVIPMMNVSQEKSRALNLQAQGLDEVLARCKGRRSRLASVLGITAAAVCKWKKIPEGRLVEIEEKLGVPREKQRPDLYTRKGAPIVCDA